MKVCRSNLTFVESERHIPFEFKRGYYLYDVPGGATRAGHAHDRLQQIIITMSGSFDFSLDDGKFRRKFHLNRSYIGLYIPPMVWHEIDFFWGVVCMVLASDFYENLITSVTMQNFWLRPAKRVKLPHLDRRNARRQGQTRTYLEGLKSSGLVPPTSVGMAEAALPIFAVRSPKRDELREKLPASGVETLIHYPQPPHLQGAYASLGCGAGAFPRAEKIAAEMLSLPIGWEFDADVAACRIAEIAGT